jgi:TATA-box binding protein (TBP) (component of TFIID and TFIIIB)
MSHKRKRKLTSKKDKHSKKKPHGVQITNVIAHCKLAHSADTKKIAIALHGRVSDVVFPACVGHCRITQTTQSVFRSGKLVVVGADSEETALMAAHLFAFTVHRELKTNVSVYNFSINNTVGCFSLPYRLNVNLFHEDHGLTSQWDPENFMGCSYKPTGSNISFVLFESGEGILTGGKSTRELFEAYDKHAHEFEKYKQGEEYRTQEECTKRRRTIAQAPGSQHEDDDDKKKKKKKQQAKAKKKKKKKSSGQKKVITP